VVRLGNKIKEMKREGIAFTEIKGDVSFENGTASVNGFLFDSEGLNFVSFGATDLVEKQFDLQTEFHISQNIDNGLRLLPFIGDAATRLTKVYIFIGGPWKDPKITVKPGRTFTEPMKELFKTPKKLLGRQGQQ
jgi:uncharacterized protein YhdP